jgi:uncharacterized protein YukE
MTTDEIDHCMTHITDILTNVSGKLNHVGDLNLALGKKLDRLADTVDELAVEQGEADRRSSERIERLTDALDKVATSVGGLAIEQGEANRRFNERFERNEERFERLISALEKRG